MTATPLSSTNRYFPPGVRQYSWVPTIADISAPLRTELDAGTDLTSEIVDGSVNGFEITADTVDVPDAGSTFTRKVNGRRSVDASSFGLYRSQDTDDARAMFADGTNGYFVIFPEGDHPASTTPAHTYTCDIYPCRVLTSTLNQSMSDGGQDTVNVAVTDEPKRNIAVPA